MVANIDRRSLPCLNLVRSIYQTAVKPDGWQNSCSGRRVDRSSIHGTFPMYCMCIVSCEVCINTAFIEIYLMFCICTRYSFYPLTAFSLHTGDASVLLKMRLLPMHWYKNVLLAHQVPSLPVSDLIPVVYIHYYLSKTNILSFHHATTGWILEHLAISDCHDRSHHPYHRWILFFH